MNDKIEAEKSRNRESEFQQIVWDDEIEDSSKPQFYDPKLDENNESWAQKQRRGRNSDAVLSCPACFTTLSLDCQRHDKYVTQYRALFVVNCKIKEQMPQPGSRRKRNGGKSADPMAVAETFQRVCCSVCSTDVGVIDEDDIYHFLNVIPTEA